jgi:hypothetical protein
VGQGRQLNEPISRAKHIEHHQSGTGIFAHQRTVSALQTAEFVTDRMPHTVLRNCWCDITVVNAHVTTEDKSKDSKDSFYKTLEQVLAFCFVWV